MFWMSNSIASWSSAAAAEVLFPSGIASSPMALLPSMAISFRFFRGSSIPKPTPNQRRADHVVASQTRCFRGRFRTGKPPYSVPRSVIETMHRATAELIASGAARRAKKAGDVAPSFSLKDPEGNIVSSDGLLKKGPLVVSFYRGVWCPYCNMELQALEAAKPVFDRYSASLLAISPQTASNSRKSVRQNKLTFPILSDAKGKIGAAFGLRFELPDYLIEL
jgi:peroxiredoxin